MMALQMSVAASAALRSSPCPSYPPPSPASYFLGSSLYRMDGAAMSRRGTCPRGGAGRVGLGVVRSSLEMAGPSVGQVTEVNKDTFWPLVKGAGTKIVVLDMYTQWCGPCKVMAPKFQQLSEKYLDVVFLKLDCNQENRALAKELGIRVVPTFKILKDSKVVREVTGAKFDDLVLAIETEKSS